MCRSCGAIVGAGETQCAVCGAPTAAQASANSNQHPADKETVRFARAVLNRPYKFTIALLVANIFIFLLMWESSGTAFAVLQRGFPDAVLLTYGAKVNYLINPPYNQWWRFVTPMFVHIDILHLLMNMFSLLILGPFVEKLYGSAKFVVFWVATGIAGTVGSYLTIRPSLAHGVFGSFIFHATDVPSAGASGALFGLVGVLFVFGIKYRRELPEGFKRVFGTGLLPIIFINLFIGFIGRSFIGNSAHLAGLFSGAALALFVDYRRPGVRASITTIWRVLQVVSLAIIVVAGYKVVRNFNRPVLAQNVPSVNAVNFLNYVSAMTQVQEKVSAVIHNNDVNDVPAVTQRAMQTPVPDARAGELRTRLLVILSNLTNGNESGRKPDQKIVDQYAQWTKEYEEWLKGAAKSYAN
ncbi:MAG TPA: rhomboid family intramembrane serine protease [Pyrinomonadaceae bacterium]|nr:rhomboid family intramembrane serine protease [Pyrinomonadaceae bacterium]